jgi:hypothetical protein
MENKGFEIFKLFSYANIQKDAQATWSLPALKKERQIGH